ncbi:ATP-binding protein [Kutzneria kofuensis]|uniref:Anti-sigma regulatory factor (Ser/Thr protein kinase)/anti-anti-sigma regulatory factor n=1 Tax=Kutzneria kofuensis TaxID=103725 RepID=A0A7W9KCB6_9PSEU|nr:ATP-binding protein [Kutzneria kofuensis]MBB5889189.1 anti-sigma regulatory factor (Ser/Thr protein kinase)/anti-anti-sigma regulatory factor [Kutzneria kofuensis]
MTHRGDAAIVRLSGEIGLRTVAHLRSALLKCLADEPSGVIVELDGTTVGAPIALGAFGALARKAAQWPGVLVALAVSDGPVRDLLHHMALDRVVPTFATVAEALRSLGAMPPRRHAAVDLPADVSSAALARRFVTDTCAGWGVDGLAADACFIASELVENAVRHGQSRPRLRMNLRRGVLTIAVRDDAPARPERRAVGAAPTGGRGLFMIDAIARAWGYAPTWAGGKVVWAVLADTACADNHP